MSLTNWQFDMTVAFCDGTRASWRGVSRSSRSRIVSPASPASSKRAAALRQEPSTSCNFCHHLSVSDRGRIVYSTDVGRVCATCGWPAKDCKCSRSHTTESVPSRLVARLRVEKKGRGGKTVTVVDNLPNNAAFLKDLCQELKRACGTGGTATEGAVELQGDQRERVRECLLKKAFVVKG